MDYSIHPNGIQSVSRAAAILRYAVPGIALAAGLGVGLAIAHSVKKKKEARRRAARKKNAKRRASEKSAAGCDMDR